MRTEMIHLIAESGILGWLALLSGCVGVVLAAVQFARARTVDLTASLAGALVVTSLFGGLAFASGMRGAAWALAHPYDTRLMFGVAMNLSEAINGATVACVAAFVQGALSVCAMIHRRGVTRGVGTRASDSTDGGT